MFLKGVGVYRGSKNISESGTQESSFPGNTEFPEGRSPWEEARMRIYCFVVYVCLFV